MEMAVHALQHAGPEPRRSAPDAGVIEDARKRQRRQRIVGLAAALVAFAVAGFIAYGTTAGGARGRITLPAPGKTSGSLGSLAASSYQFWVTPSLSPGTASIDIAVQYPTGSWDGGGLYLGRNFTIALPAPVAVSVDNRLGLNGGPTEILFVASNVAAVRVGHFGIAAARPASGLPLGAKVVAFTLPSSAAGIPTPRPGPVLTALDRDGQPIPTSARASQLVQRAWAGLVDDPSRQWTAYRGRCAIASSLPGLTQEEAFSAATLTPLPAGVPGLFTPCLDDKYALGRSQFNVAILVDAHRPGTRLASLWDAAPIHGHPGIFVMKPPSQFPPNQDSSAPLYARRIDNAWLIAQARPGFAPNPAVATRIKVLESIHITRLNVRP